MKVKQMNMYCIVYFLLKGDSCEEPYKWNEPGTGLFFENYPFPVVSLQNESVVNFTIREVCQHFCDCSFLDNV